MFSARFNLRRILAGLAIAVLPAASHAASMSLVPTADALTSASNSANNYGAAGQVAAAGPSASKGAFQGLLRFDLSSAKSAFDSAYGVGNWTLQAVTLQLTTGNTNNALFNSNAAGNVTISWCADDTWVEGTGTPNVPTSDGVTYSTHPTESGDQSLGTINYAGGASGVAYTGTLSPSAGFSDDLHQSNGSDGVTSLRVTAVDAAMSFTFNSREFGTASSRPTLTLTAVPEPASGLMLLPSAALLLRRRGNVRRRS